MNPAHEDILRRHRTDIVKVLDVAHVKDSLIEHGVFSTQLWDEIEKAGGESKREKASRLLDRLPTRGPNAFSCFCEALMAGEYDFLGEQLTEEAEQQHVLESVQARGRRTPSSSHHFFEEVAVNGQAQTMDQSLSGQINNIKKEYRKCLLRGKGVTLVKALNKVIHFKKLRGKRASEQTVTSLKYIKEALKSPSFDESNVSALTDILDLVEKLKHIRDELQKDGSVHDHVTKLNSMLADGADFSTLYKMTLDIGVDYLRDFGMQGMDAASKFKFGSVLVLIPYLCDLSEQAVQLTKRRVADRVDNSPSSEAERMEPFSDVVVEGVAMSPYPEQDEVFLPEGQSSRRSYVDVEGTMMSRLDRASERIGRLEQTQIRYSQDRDRTSNGILEEIKKLNSKMDVQALKIDQMDKKIEQQSILLQQNEDIKASLFDVSNHLEYIKKALGGQTEKKTVLEAKVSSLEGRVLNLLEQEIDRSKLMEEIKGVESEVVELKEWFQDGDLYITERLEQMNRHLLDVLLKLERDSLGRQLSTAIDMVEKQLKFKEFTRFARMLGFSDQESTKIRSAARDNFGQQKSELLRKWREKNGSNATAKHLEQACRSTGLSTLADKISRISGAPSAAHAVRLPSLTGGQGNPNRPVVRKTSYQELKVVNMDPAHENILQRNRGRIVKDLNVDRIKDSLIQNGVFTPALWDDIATAGKGIRQDKASALMDELPRRGPDAFSCFCESLLTKGYDFLGKPLIEEDSSLGLAARDVHPPSLAYIFTNQCHI
ncbi:Caspase recruitment domain [Branchiostoma belcheri]|nr:Caspase recruitment domain [Branchiostoma belcheri]